MERHLVSGVADFLHQGGRRRGGALCRHVSAILSLTLERGKGEVSAPPLRAVQKPLERKAYKVLNVHASPLHLPPLLPGLLLLAYGGIGIPLHLLQPP